MSDADTKNPSDPEMRPEYDFDYGTSRPNRFASRFGEGSVAVVLDPDVASVLSSSESVNALLRSVIAAMRRAGDTAPSTGDA